jgi:hypothetical protein
MNEDIEKQLEVKLKELNSLLELCKGEQITSYSLLCCNSKLFEELNKLRINLSKIKK